MGTAWLKRAKSPKSHSALTNQDSALITQHSGTQHSALSTQHSALSTQHSALSTQHSALSTQHSALSTQHSALSTQPYVYKPLSEPRRDPGSAPILRSKARGREDLLAHRCVAAAVDRGRR